MGPGFRQRSVFLQDSFRPRILTCPAARRKDRHPFAEYRSGSVRRKRSSCFSIDFDTFRLLAILSDVLQPVPVDPRNITCYGGWSPGRTPLVMKRYRYFLSSCSNALAQSLLPMATPFLYQNTACSLLAGTPSPFWYKFPRRRQAPASPARAAF